MEKCQSIKQSFSIKKDKRQEDARKVYRNL